MPAHQNPLPDDGGPSPRSSPGGAGGAEAQPHSLANDVTKTEPEQQKNIAPAPGPPPVPDGIKSNGKHILIVEDERPLAHALELKFHHEGFETHICLDGEEALKEAINGKYDVILLDLIMPRMDGFTFLQEMKAKGVKTPTVVLSNLGQDEDKTRTQQLGAVGYFVKSNTPIMEIIKQVQSLL